MQVEVSIGMHDEFVDESMRHLFAVTPGGVTRENAVGIHSVDGTNEHAPVPERRQVQDRHENDRAGEVGRFELAGQTNDRFDRGIFSPVHSCPNEQGFPWLRAGDRDHRPWRVAQVGARQGDFMPLLCADY